MCHKKLPRLLQRRFSNSCPHIPSNCCRQRRPMRFALCLLTAVAVSLFVPNALHGACSQLKPDSTDAVAAAPDHHKVILENDAVRVLEATVPLHAKEPPHTHFWPSVFFEQTSGRDEPWKTVNIRWSAGGPSKGYD